MPPTITTPTLLTDPGFLWVAPLGTADPTNTVAGSVFTDVIGAAWIPMGATADGSVFNYQTTVTPLKVAELLDPVKYVTTDRAGTLAFALADFTLSNYNRALNGGVAALTATSGTGATSLYTVQPPAPGSEVRSMILWESTDNTIRLLCRQVFQGGSIQTTVKRGEVASMPCTFNLEVPSGGNPFTLWSAGTSRG